MFQFENFIDEFWEQYIKAETDEDLKSILKWIDAAIIEYSCDYIPDPSPSNDGIPNVIDIYSAFPIESLCAQIWLASPKALRSVIHDDRLFLFSPALEKIQNSELEQLYTLAKSIPYEWKRPKKAQIRDKGNVIYLFR